MITPQVVGLGEVVHDASHARVGDGFSYRGSRGGGSVWNTLANAAAMQAQVGAISVAGSDSRYELASRDNSSLGIEELFTENFRGGITATMHHFPTEHDGKLLYETTTKCLRCQQRIHTGVISASPQIAAGPAELEVGKTMLIVDKLTALRVRWAEQIKSVGGTTVIDIGHPGYLRFEQPTILLSWLSAFDVIVMQKKVERFLCMRLRIERDEMARRLGKLILVSDGANGADIIDARGGRIRVDPIPAPATEVVDTVGAGDCLLGNFVALLVKSGEGTGGVNQANEVYRELIRESMEQVPRALSMVGPRGHLAGALQQLPAIDDPSVSNGGCAICGSKPRTLHASATRPRSPLAKSNLGQVSRRVRAVVEDSAALESVRALIDHPVNTVFTGTGGSFAAARAMATMTQEVWKTRGVTTAMVTAVRPLDIVAGYPGIQRLVGISYSGGTSDVWKALEWSGIRGAEKILITASSAVRDESTKVIGYGNSPRGSVRGKERGFISIAATLTAASLWAAATAGSDALIDVLNLSDLPSRAREAAIAAAEVCSGERGLTLIGGPRAGAAMADIESKFIEGALAPVYVHDAKDFSHGRFVSLSGRNALSSAVLLISDAEQSDYDQHLKYVLSRNVEHLFELRSTFKGSQGVFDLMMAAQHFGVEFGIAKGIDISRPQDLGNEWISLYRWSGELAEDNLAGD